MGGGAAVVCGGTEGLCGWNRSPPSSGRMEERSNLEHSRSCVRVTVRCEGVASWQCVCGKLGHGGHDHDCDSEWWSDRWIRVCVEQRITTTTRASEQRRQGRGYRGSAGSGVQSISVTGTGIGPNGGGRRDQHA